MKSATLAIVVLLAACGEDVQDVPAPKTVWTPKDTCQEEVAYPVELSSDPARTRTRIRLSELDWTLFQVQPDTADIHLKWKVSVRCGSAFLKRFFVTLRGVDRAADYADLEATLSGPTGSFTYKSLSPEIAPGGDQLIWSFSDLEWDRPSRRGQYVPAYVNEETVEYTFSIPFRVLVRETRLEAYVNLITIEDVPTNRTFDSASPWTRQDILMRITTL